MLAAPLQLMSFNCLLQASWLQKHAKRARVELQDLLGLGSRTCTVSLLQHLIGQEASHKTSPNSRSGEIDFTF